MKPGDIVTIDFPGVMGIKRRPAVVVSTVQYHRHRPDIIVGILTTKTQEATSPMDYILKDWSEAGLRRATAFRSFFATLPVSTAQLIGHCSERDWQSIQIRLARAIDISRALRVKRE